MSKAKRATDRRWREVRAAILAANQTCGICGEIINVGLSGLHPDGPNIDHIIPLAHGGSDDLANLMPTHRRCNLAKGAKRQSGPLAW